MSQDNVKEISRGDGFGEATVRASGIRVELHADASVDVYTKEPVHAHRALKNDDRLLPTGKIESKPGERMEDGTVYAGISPDTNRPMYATAGDAPLTMTFSEAQKYAEKLDAHGYQDWRLPTTAELNVLFNNRAAIGGFDRSGSEPAGWYWSTSPFHEWDAWGQRFSDGNQDNYGKGYRSSVRCVRG